MPIGTPGSKAAYSSLHSCASLSSTGASATPSLVSLILRRGRVRVVGSQYVDQIQCRVSLAGIDVDAHYRQALQLSPMQWQLVKRSCC
jgi:hypothetical protein